MAEDLVVRFCSPTLAGIKAGSLFVCPFADGAALQRWLRSFNRRLGGKGLRVLSLRYRGGKALIYVYRPRMLERDLLDHDAERILSERGFLPGPVGRRLAQLIRRLACSGEFPHEIGLFLGYPPEDVSGFICGDRECKCTGCWKVYGDVESARLQFSAFKRCTEQYCFRFAHGCTLEELAVAG